MLPGCPHYSWLPGCRHDRTPAKGAHSVTFSETRRSWAGPASTRTLTPIGDAPPAGLLYELVDRRWFEDAVTKEVAEIKRLLEAGERGRGARGARLTPANTLCAMLKAGDRFACPECPTEVIVTRAADADVALTCAAVTLVYNGDPRPASGHAGGGAAGGEPAQLGKRYVDEQTGLEMLCTKAGTGALGCDGRVLTLRSAKPLPSSD